MSGGGQWIQQLLASGFIRVGISIGVEKVASQLPMPMPTDRVVRTSYDAFRYDGAVKSPSITTIRNIFT
jgi:hypothetical protein